MRFTDNRRWERHDRTSGLVDYPGLDGRVHRAGPRVFVKPPQGFLDMLWVGNVHIGLWPFIWLALQPDMVGTTIFAWAFACVFIGIHLIFRDFHG